METVCWGSWTPKFAFGNARLVTDAFTYRTPSGSRMYRLPVPSTTIACTPLSPAVVALPASPEATQLPFPATVVVAYGNEISKLYWFTAQVFINPK